MARKETLLMAITLSLNGCVTTSTTSTPVNANSCLGPPDAKGNAIYFHGLMGEAGEPKKVLDFLISSSQESQLRFAMPRAYMPCADHSPKDKYCWHWGPESLETLKERFADVQQRARSCFANTKDVHVFIGFSNGGGFLNRLYQNCQFTKGDVVISIGNGLHKWHKPQYEGDLKNCGKLYLLIGKADQHNKDNAQYAYQTLKVRGADVTLHEYEGEHEMNRNLPKLDELIGRP